MAKDINITQHKYAFYRTNDITLLSLEQPIPLLEMVNRGIRGGVCIALEGKTLIVGNGVLSNFRYDNSTVPPTTVWGEIMFTNIWTQVTIPDDLRNISSEKLELVANYLTALLVYDPHKIPPHRYKKRPIEITAIQWLGTNFVEIDNFITCDHKTYPKDGIVEISTLEGVATASLNDWIIKSVKGEFYTCKPDVFEATYSEVNN